MTSEWINSYLDDNQLSREFLKAQPFEHLSIDHLFNPDKLKELVQELQSLEYYLEDHDLYQFLRTVDFKHIQNPLIKEFRDFIFSDEFVSFIESIVGFKLERNKGDLHSLQLKDSHYLLCHDDQVQDRSIAFILNLSQDWSSQKGGFLELFNSNASDLPTTVGEKILPSFNQFNMFKVSSRSYHQISEVIGEDSERLSISGWFYKTQYKRDQK